MNDHRYVGAFAVIILALCCVGIARAQEPPGTRPTVCHMATPANAVCLVGTAPTTRVDGTPITQPLTYRFEHRTGSTWTTIANNLPIPRHYVTNLTPGTHTFRMYAIEQGLESAASNEGSRDVPHPAPLPPVIQVVQVVVGVDHAPVFTVLADGTRSSTVGGFAAVGTVCEGPVLFRYRNRDYRRPTAWKPWATSAAARVGAPCS